MDPSKDTLHSDLRMMETICWALTQQISQYIQGPWCCLHWHYNKSSVLNPVRCQTNSVRHLPTRFGSVVFRTYPILQVVLPSTTLGSICWAAALWIHLPSKMTVHLDLRMLLAICCLVVEWIAQYKQGSLCLILCGAGPNHLGNYPSDLDVQSLKPGLLEQVCYQALHLGQCVGQLSNGFHPPSKLTVHSNLEILMAIHWAAIQRIAQYKQRPYLLTLEWLGSLVPAGPRSLLHRHSNFKVRDSNTHP